MFKDNKKDVVITDPYFKFKNNSTGEWYINEYCLSNFLLGELISYNTYISKYNTKKIEIYRGEITITYEIEENVYSDDSTRNGYVIKISELSTKKTDLFKQNNFKELQIIQTEIDEYQKKLDDYKNPNTNKKVLRIIVKKFKGFVNTFMGAAVYCNTYEAGQAISTEQSYVGTFEAHVEMKWKSEITNFKK